LTRGALGFEPRGFFLIGSFTARPSIAHKRQLIFDHRL
jgi:hypothetical protein